MVQTAIGLVSRKRKQFDLTQQSLLEAGTARQRIFSIDNNVCVNSIIQLALTYREAGYREKVKETLNVISPSQVFTWDFERNCQISHIRALLDLDAGCYVRARLTLETLLDSDRNKNNRELLWVHIDLAHILREHREHDKVLMLFSELVKPINWQEIQQEDPLSSLNDEPEPTDRLKIAEEALKLVRAARPVAAEKLLVHNSLKWVQQEDFWILQDGPITDTA